MRIVHYPSNPEVFEFDKSVADIFHDMAVRSIPNYLQSHALVADIILGKLYRSEERALVLDIGTSRGYFFTALWSAFENDRNTPLPNIGCIGVDSSPDMLHLARADYPHVLFIDMDVSRTDNIASIDGEFDVVNMSYVMQFIPRKDRFNLLYAISRKMKKGGLLFLSQKYEVDTAFSKVFDRMYRDFRMCNGYSEDEIDAKNKALRNSMWIDTKEDTEELLEDTGFFNITEICSMLQFNTIVAEKRL